MLQRSDTMDLVNIHRVAELEAEVKFKDDEIHDLSSQLQDIKEHNK